MKYLLSNVFHVWGQILFSKNACNNVSHSICAAYGDLPFLQPKVEFSFLTTLKLSGLCDYINKKI